MMSARVHNGFTTARAADLLAHVRRSGTKRGAHGLIIAATASATQSIVLTTDRGADVQDLPGVDCIVVAGAIAAGLALADGEIGPARTARSASWPSGG